jgi:hypothetical protein
VRVNFIQGSNSFEHAFDLNGSPASMRDTYCAVPGGLPQDIGVPLEILVGER